MLKDDDKMAKGVAKSGYSSVGGLADFWVALISNTMKSTPAPKDASLRSV